MCINKFWKQVTVFCLTFLIGAFFAGLLSWSYSTDSPEITSTKVESSTLNDETSASDNFTLMQCKALNERLNKRPLDEKELENMDFQIKQQFKAEKIKEASGKNKEKADARNFKNVEQEWSELEKFIKQENLLRAKCNELNGRK